MMLVKIINLVRFNGDFIFVIVCDVLMLSKWCITVCGIKRWGFRSYEPITR